MIILFIVIKILINVLDNEESVSQSPVNVESFLNGSTSGQVNIYLLIITLH